MDTPGAAISPSLRYAVDAPPRGRLSVAVRIMNLTERHAADICTWRYPAPYQCYDVLGAVPGYFLAPANGFFALVDDDGELIGYRSFGPDGQVPGGGYQDDALDTGGGLRPELTGLGRGLGRRAIATGLAFGLERFRPTAFRVTVADFNGRARHVVESLGFVHVSSFAASTDSSRFHVFLRSAARADQTDVVGDDDRLHPVPRADLREGAADVRLDG